MSTGWTWSLSSTREAQWIIGKCLCLPHHYISFISGFHQPSVKNPLFLKLSWNGCFTVLSGLMIYTDYADTSLHPAAHIQNTWTFLWGSLVHLDRFGISIMQREPEFGKIISKLSLFCFYESPSYFYENVNNVGCTVCYQLVAQCFYLLLIIARPCFGHLQGAS